MDRRRREVKSMVEDALSGRIDRRELLRRAATLGVAVPGALAMSTSVGAAAPPRRQDETPKPGGKLTALIVDDPKYLDIHVTQLAQSRQMMASIYETLVVVDAEDGEIKGRLAEEWTFSESTQLDITLQEGVKFHEGQDFTAEDVKWTIEYVLDPETGSPNASILEQVASVEVLEPLRVRFHLKQPWPAIVEQLTTIQIYSQTATPDAIATQPNGTGPFKWDEWIPGDHVTLRRNEEYWRDGLPYLDEIEFRPVTEQATRIATMEAGAADVMFTPELKDKERIDDNPNLQAVASLLNDSGYILYMNNSRPPMDNLQIRLAASYALDRNAYFQSPTLAGQGEKNTSPWTRTHWAYNPINDDAFEYDLERAAQHLAEGGYPEGRSEDGTRLSINLVYPAGYPELRDGSTLFQSAMEQLGVEVRVEELELATWIDRIVNTDEYDMSWDYHFQRAIDPAWTLSYAFFYPPGPQNICRYEDEQIAELINEGGSELDQEKRRDIYFQYQERWNEIQPGLIVGEFLLFHATQNDVKGFYTHPLLFQDFSGVWLDR